MNLQQLKEAVDSAVEHCSTSGTSPEDITVGIPVERFGTLGCHPFANVTRSGLGFDWEAGKFFIWADTAIREIEHDELKILEKKFGEHSSLIYKNKRLEADIKRLEDRLNDTAI